MYYYMLHISHLKLHQNVYDGDMFSIGCL